VTAKVKQRWEVFVEERYQAEQDRLTADFVRLVEAIDTTRDLIMSTFQLARLCGLPTGRIPVVIRWSNKTWTPGAPVVVYSTAVGYFVIRRCQKLPWDRQQEAAPQ
jgi:hypothetical protein